MATIGSCRRVQLLFVCSYSDHLKRELVKSTRTISVLYPRKWSHFEISLDLGIIQKPSSTRRRGTEAHNRQHGKMEQRYVEDGADSADDSSNQQRNGVLSFQYHAFLYQSPKRERGTPSLLFVRWTLGRMSQGLMIGIASLTSLS